MELRDARADYGGALPQAGQEYGEREGGEGLHTGGCQEPGGRVQVQPHLALGTLGSSCCCALLVDCCALLLCVVG